MSGISRLIRSATLYGYAELAESLGLNTAAQLRRAGLSLAMLQEPDHPIRLDAACSLLEASSTASKLDDFGLRLAARRRLANLGAVSVVLREEPNGLAALGTLCRYLQLVNPSLSTRIDETGAFVVIREELMTDAQIPMRQSTEMAVGVMHGILRELLGSTWRACRVCFAHRPPSDNSFAKKLFACPLDYNADFNGIVCLRSDLVVQLPGTDAALARYIQTALDKALAQAPKGTAAHVRQWVAVLLPQGRCTADQLASLLGVDRRTLHRHLAREGLTFSSVLQSVRKDLVARQLKDGDRSVMDIAHLLGFGSSSALAHWFAKHHGQSVQQWRQAVQAQIQ